MVFHCLLYLEIGKCSEKLKLESKIIVSVENTLMYVMVAVNSAIAYWVHTSQINQSIYDFASITIGGLTFYLWKSLFEM